MWKAHYLRRFKLSNHQLSALMKRNWKQLFIDRSRINKNWTNGDVKVGTIVGHEDSVYCLQYDNEKIISGSRDKTIKYWKMIRGEYKCYKTLVGHAGSVLCLQFDNNVIVSGSSDRSIIVWNVNTGDIIRQLHSHVLPVLDIRFDKSHIYSCSKGTQLYSHLKRLHYKNMGIKYWQVIKDS